jgi:hypothetical protein
VRALYLLSAAHLFVTGVHAEALPTDSDERLRQLTKQAPGRWTASQAPSPAPADQTARMLERAELLQRGEHALIRIDIEAAQQAFDRAALILHAADSEMGLTRTYMQGGEYRRALAFSAHTAGAHPDVAGGIAMYAWLLHIGGQVSASQRLLDDAETRMPANPLLGAVRRQLRSTAPLPTGDLLAVPARLAPYGSSTGLSPWARVAGSGIVSADGRKVLVPISTLTTASTIWVRNGLGHLRRAMVERRLVTANLAVLQLEKALPVDPDFLVATTDAFPGSVAFAVEYVASSDAAPRWPLLTSGFLGQPLPRDNQRQLGIAMGNGPRGGPVFDAGGRLIGIAVRSPGGADQLVLASQLRKAVGELVGPSSPPVNARVPLDRIYEAALRTTVQVIVSR